MRRISLSLRGFWHSLIIQKSEQRADRSLVDYMFLIIATLLVVAAVILLMLLLYGIKNLIGIDIFPGVHFLYVE